MMETKNNEILEERKEYAFHRILRLPESPVYPFKTNIPEVKLSLHLPVRFQFRFPAALKEKQHFTRPHLQMLSPMSHKKLRL